MESLCSSFFLFLKSSIWIVGLELHFWKLIYDQGNSVHEISKVEKHLQFIFLNGPIWVLGLELHF